VRRPCWPSVLPNDDDFATDHETRRTPIWRQRANAGEARARLRGVGEHHRGIELPALRDDELAAPANLETDTPSAH
jgi:hypothetical protein